MKNKLLILLIGILLLLTAAFVGGRLPYFLLYTYIGLLLLPFFHGLLGHRKIIGSIQLPTRDLIAGETITMSTRFKNPTKKVFPHLEYRNHLAEHLSGNMELAKTFHIGPEEQFVDQVEVHCKRRGLYNVGETELIIKDVFNLFHFRKKIQGPISLKVYPRILPFSYFDIEAGVQMGDLIVDDPLFQDYSAIEALRDYRDGDSVKKIHWKASAKQDHIIVKDFEYRGDAEVMLLANNSRESYVGDAYRYLEDAVVDVAVSVTDFCLKNHLSTHYVLPNSKHYKSVKGNSDAYLRAFLEEFVLFAADNQEPFYKHLLKLKPSIPQGTTLIIVTPVMDKYLATTLVDFKMHNIRPMVFLIQNASVDASNEEDQNTLTKKLMMESIPIQKITL